MSLTHTSGRQIKTEKHWMFQKMTTTTQLMPLDIVWKCQINQKHNTIFYELLLHSETPSL